MNSVMQMLFWPEHLPEKVEHVGARRATLSKLSPATVNDAPIPTPSLHVQLHAQPPTSVIHRPDGQRRQCRASPLRAPLPLQRESCLSLSVLTGPKISLPPFLPLPFALRDRLFPCFPFSCASLPPCLLSSSEGEHQLFSSPSAFLHFPSLCLNDDGLNFLGQRFQTNSSKDGLERKQSSKGSRYCGGSQR